MMSSMFASGRTSPAAWARSTSGSPAACRAARQLLKTSALWLAIANSSSASACFVAM
jgi:hypothetical protein